VGFLEDYKTQFDNLAIKVMLVHEEICRVSQGRIYSLYLGLGRMGRAVVIHSRPFVTVQKISQLEMEERIRK
jgi:hypothetical protein